MAVLQLDVGTQWRLDDLKFTALRRQSFLAAAD
jgi:hypothetical protein